MPNWCHNTLEVSSDDERTIAIFRERARVEKSDLSFHCFLPTPERLKNAPACTRPSDPKEAREYDLVRAKNIAEYGEPDWYEWNCRNWGTKWDVNASLTESRKRYLKYEFDTAWSPPIPWTRHVSACFPDVVFFLSFVEPGMCLAGTASALAGVVEANKDERVTREMEARE